MIRILAPGVWRKRQRLKALLGPEVSFRFGQTGQAHAVAGWGLKGGGRAHAKAKGLPYLALEDAFLATLGEQRHGYGQLGLIADPVGIYYDARQPSFSEQLIQDSASVPETDDDRHLMAMLREHRLGKFNSLDPDDLNHTDDVDDYNAIVVDQIAGDLSIEGGLADSGTFTTMLTAAIDTHGTKGVAVKLHPFDGYGGRQGHLAELAQRYGLAVLPKRAPWMAFAERASRVYVVSSNAGLEALIAGASVTTFGVPFYGGYGLTDDHQTVERRTSKPSLGQLCRAVYQEYGRYWLPGVERQSTV
ncbi:MAG: capsular polysaccharide biosynthesis protein, partial [Pseudomonadota bacterium]